MFCLWVSQANARIYWYLVERQQISLIEFVLQDWAIADMSFCNSVTKGAPNFFKIPGVNFFI